MRRRGLLGQVVGIAAALAGCSGILEEDDTEDGDTGGDPGGATDGRGSASGVENGTNGTGSDGGNSTTEDATDGTDNSHSGTRDVPDPDEVVESFQEALFADDLQTASSHVHPDAWRVDPEHLRAVYPAESEPEILGVETVEEGDSTRVVAVTVEFHEPLQGERITEEPTYELERNDEAWEIQEMASTPYESRVEGPDADLQPVQPIDMDGHVYALLFEHQGGDAITFDGNTWVRGPDGQTITDESGMTFESGDRLEIGLDGPGEPVAWDAEIQLLWSYPYLDSEVELASDSPFTEVAGSMEDYLRIQ